MRERVRFNRMDQRARLSGRRNQVIPPPRGEVAALTKDTGHVRGNRIDASEIVEEPGVDPVRFQRLLDGVEIQRAGRR